MNCLRSLPPKTDQSFAPGARNRYDDFVVSHIINTQTIHFSGWFLPWHRQYVWLFENALRTECNYTGYLPYWDWSKLGLVTNSTNPLFDGSATSLSDNGKYEPNRNLTHISPIGMATLNANVPLGTGGGCIQTGPIVNWQQHLGPVNSLNGEDGRRNPNATDLGYNPRCIKRDFNNTLLAMHNSYANVTNLILNSSSRFAFFNPLEHYANRLH